jgi:predicted dienelactone hydrolase
LVVLVISTAARTVPADGSRLLRTNRGLTYREWLPKGFARRQGDVPLILFSHGFGGCAQQSATLTRALAEAGYAVLAPNHRDEGCEHYRGNLAAALSVSRLRPEQPFTHAAAWGPETEISRRNDLDALLQFALSHAPYRDAIDRTRIGVMGHSLGGYAALGLAGAWPSWRDPRIKAALALSPYTAPFVLGERLAAISIPVMYQTGTRDIGIGPVLLRAGGGYEMTGGPKYLVVLKGASHFAWTELNLNYQDIIAAYARSFFDRTLLGKAAPLLDAVPHPQVSLYRCDL